MCGPATPWVAAYRAGQDDRALEWLNQAIAANPGNKGFEETSLTMALVQYRKGQKEEARQWIDRFDAFWNSMLQGDLERGVSSKVDR